jgi:hypothetical protein
VEEVLAVLARERRALEQLLFRLLHARGVLVADDERFLGMAADELELAAQTVRELETARATMIGSSGQPTLRSLVDQAVEPYASLLQEHHVALGRLAGEVGAMLESTSELANDRLAELRGDRPGAFRRSRRPRVGRDDLDRAMVAAGYESLLNVSGSVRLPALVSFLR